LLARLLLSAVIEGDRRDTAEFMNGAQFPAKREGDELREMWGACLERMEKKLLEFPTESPIDWARRAISDQCRKAAEERGGVFRLNVPTGGGKTLSALRYALAHAEKFGKERIIFTSPLLSILEQNAAVIRGYVQDDGLILEHHSNLIRPKDGEGLDELELLTETWDAPIIITTLVQLLNTLFSGKTTAIRRFHALCNSVIVIDEVQTVPSKMLSLFSLTVNFLTEICGATVVLCSATQPCMERIAHPIHTPIPDLASCDSALWRAFQRTEIQDAGTKLLDEIAGFAREQLERVELLAEFALHPERYGGRLDSDKAYSPETRGKMTARFWHPVIRRSGTWHWTRAIPIEAICLAGCWPSRRRWRAVPTPVRSGGRPTPCGCRRRSRSDPLNGNSPRTKKCEPEAPTDTRMVRTGFCGEKPARWPVKRRICGGLKTLFVTCVKFP